MNSSDALTILAGGAHSALAKAVAHDLGVPLACAEVQAFSDGETRVHIAHPCRERHVVILQPTSPPVNDHMMALALLADAACAAGAARVTAVVPYFGYARQELRKRVGDPRSAQFVGKLLASAGIDELITIDLHAPALESALPMPAIVLDAEEVLLPHIRRWEVPQPVVVAPDAGGLKRAQRYAHSLGADLAVIAKERPRPDVATPSRVLGDVRQRDCLIVDDMATTGKTLIGAAEALRARGARDVYAAFTHAVFSPGAAQAIAAAGFAKVVTTDSIAIPRDVGRWLEIVPVTPLLTRAIREQCDGPTRSLETAT